MSGILVQLWENFNYVFHDLNDDLVNFDEGLWDTAKDRDGWRSLGETFAQQWDEKDDRTRDIWPNCLTLLAILFLYLYFIKVAGPAWMMDKKPYKLKNTILFYNAFQVIVSFYLFYESFFNVWLAKYNFTCQPVDYSDTPEIKQIHNLVWMYLIQKLTDLLDTVFFVLRKKDQQISGLHVYHHFMMPILVWTGLKFFPNGHGTLLGVINCLVHTVMYTYYLLAGLGPRFQKYLWWKKHVTTLQLVQFVIVFLHNVYPLFTDCNYPKWINTCLSMSALHFVYMFGNFYYVTYIKKQRKLKK